jgi:cardiolipin synthase
MTHVKTLIVDGLWSVIGTTNIDNRSFEHNDEVNVVIRDLAIAARLRADFEADKAVSDEVSLERWRSRSPIERMLSMGAGVLERQQ